MQSQIISQLKTIAAICLGLLIVSVLSACSKQNNAATADSSKGGNASVLSAQQEGFAKVVAKQTLHFPLDHQAHNDYKVEWWYLTANLKTESGQPLGLQWTQFRIGLTPGAPKDKPTNLWQTKQLYMAHAAVTNSQQHLAAEKWSRGHGQFAGVTEDPLTIELDDWQWRSQNNGLFPAELHVNQPNFSYTLQLNSDAPIQLQGDQGYSIKVADASVASYYYSQPFIDISGEVEINGKREKVTGKGWLDREWSSQFLTRNQQGWDWFAIRLDDGSALMLFQLRGDKNFYSAKRMFADGRGYNIASDAINMEPLTWHQTDNGHYPVSWNIVIPNEHIDITIQPLNSNSVMPLTTQYWEGPINISGSHHGQGYMELTGYEE